MIAIEDCEGLWAKILPTMTFFNVITEVGIILPIKNSFAEISENVKMSSLVCNGKLDKQMHEMLKISKPLDRFSETYFWKSRSDVFFTYFRHTTYNRHSHETQRENPTNIPSQ